MPIRQHPFLQEQISDGDLEACFNVITGNSCPSECKSVVDRAGKECLLELVDANSEGVSDKEILDRINKLKGTLNAC
ncbi:hypothetical protein COHA_003294 [Chlorella ohadii]|uniref:Uncharacterized protein n=1 Tax=Chlorella ohadii TaxID=2649997 RepID=A0AAD5H6Z3_9CHLO|nr:hypothetical protein COHA_003294 [Chlorella ohadii]